MSEEPVFQILRRYEPLNAQVDLSRTGGPEADLMYTLATDPAAYQAYVADPDTTLVANGLDPARMDVARYTDLANQLHERVQDKDRWSVIAGSVTDKETSEGQSSNWDHSSSWFMNKDGMHAVYDKGHNESTDTRSEAGTDKSFKGIDIGNPQELLRHQLDLLFYPAQPLVTPGLVDQIKAEVEQQGGPQ